MIGKSKYNELQKYVYELESKVKDLEKQLMENNEKTEKLKTRFLSNISHELRTPMNAILGFSNLMIDKNLSHKKKEEYMEHINISSNSLLNLVDSMIDVSLLEINALTIRKEAFNLDKLMQQMYHYFNIDKHKTGKSHIVLLFNQYRKDGDFTITSDSYRLTQVLSCLLHNAFKFTSKGIVEFGYKVREDQKLHFYVKDSGKGILADRASMIFEKFEKIEDDPEISHGGLGLGLTLAKGLIGLLGGDIWVDSNVYQGSTFNFTIDYQENFKNNTEKKTTFQRIIV
jgi:signal transduction histidine kinase